MRIVSLSVSHLSCCIVASLALEHAQLRFNHISKLKIMYSTPHSLVLAPSLWPQKDCRRFSVISRTFSRTRRPKRQIVLQLLSELESVSV